jgi:hypothetical protein
MDALDLIEDLLQANHDYEIHNKPSYRNDFYQKKQDAILYIANLQNRVRELIALMEGDIAFKDITAGDTRQKILAQARALVPDMAPAKTLDDILK